MIFPLLLALATLSPTPIPPTPTPKPDSEIEKIRQVIQEKVKEKLQEIREVNTDPKRGYAGTITQITENVISLDTTQASRKINTNVDTTFINLKSNKIRFSDLKVGQEILAIGILNESEELDAKRIIITTLKNIQNTKLTVFGQVVDVSKSSPILVVIPITDKNTQYQVKYSQSTPVFDKTGQKSTIDTVKTGQKLVIIGTLDTQNKRNLLAQKLILL